MFFFIITILLSITQSLAYDFQNHQQLQAQSIQNNYPISHHKNNYTAVESRDNFAGSYSSYGWANHAPDHHHHESNTPSHGQNKGQSLHSYFDIALTALAFLSFGIFLLNLLLNALLFAGLVTSTGTATGTGTETDSRHGVARGKRATLELFLDPVSSMDALAHNVLKSIDAMMEKHECVGKVFCEGNRQAKIIGSGFQYLMPLYSMSASYFGKKFGWHEDTLQHLMAIGLGVGDSNCHSHFPQC